MSQVNIVSPDQPDDAVVALPDHQHPYGDPCPLNCRFQSVLWHYDVVRASADVLINRNIHGLKQIRFINPDAGVRTDQRKLFKEFIEDGIADPLQRYLVTCALRRMLRPDPFAAIVRAAEGASSSRSNAADGVANPPASVTGGGGLPAAPSADSVDDGALKKARRAGRTDDVVRFSYKKVLGPQESDLCLVLWMLSLLRSVSLSFLGLVFEIVI